MVSGEWSEISSFQSNVSTVQVVLTNIAVHPFKTELPWSSHRFYTNSFSRESAMKRSRLHEQKRAYMVLVFCEETVYSS